MSLEKFDGIKHITKILRKVASLDSLWVLADMNLDSKFDQDIVQQVISDIFDPIEFFRELQIEELRTLLNELPKDVLTRFLKEDFGFRKIYQNLNGKTLLQKNLSYHPNNSWEICVQKTLFCLYKMVWNGKISYNGIVLYLNPLSCKYPKNVKQKNKKIFFQILNPFVHTNSGIKIIVYSHKDPFGIFTLEIQKMNGGVIAYFDIQLDELGFYFGEHYTERQIGLSKAILKNSDNKCIIKTFCFSPSSRSLYKVLITNVFTQNDIVKVTAKIYYNETKIVPEKFIRSVVYCSKCGLPITINKCKLQNDTFYFQFSIQDHSNDFFLFTYFADHQASCSFNIFQFNEDDFLFQESKDHKEDDVINIDFSGFQDSVIFYNVTTSKYFDQKINNNLLIPSEPLENFPKKKEEVHKKSPMELSFNKHILLLSDSKGDEWNWGYFQNIGSSLFFYQPNLSEIKSDLYFTFFKFSPSGLKPIFKYISKAISVKNQNIFWNSDKTQNLNLQKVIIQCCERKSIGNKHDQEIEFFKKPEDFSDEIFRRYILNNPWDLKEEAVYRINVLCHYMIEHLPIHSNHTFYDKLSRLINTLNSYIDEIEKGSIELDFIYLILLELKPYKEVLFRLFPIFYEIINKLDDIWIENKVLDFFQQNVSYNHYLEEFSFSNTIIGENFQVLLIHTIRILLKRNINHLNLQSGYKKSSIRIKRKGLQSILEGMNIIDKKTVKIQKPKYKKVDRIIEKLLPFLEISFLNNSYPRLSTIMGLFHLSKELQVQTENDFRFIIKTSDLQLRDYKTQDLYFRISNNHFSLGEIQTIYFLKSVHGFILHLFLPIFLEVLWNNRFVDNIQFISLKPFSNIKEIHLRPIQKGRGNLKIVLESVFTNTIKVFDLGTIVVL